MIQEGKETCGGGSGSCSGGSELQDERNKMDIKRNRMFCRACRSFSLNLLLTQPFVRLSLMKCVNIGRKGSLSPNLRPRPPCHE